MSNNINNYSPMDTKRDGVSGKRHTQVSSESSKRIKTNENDDMVDIDLSSYFDYIKEANENINTRLASNTTHLFSGSQQKTNVDLVQVFRENGEMFRDYTIEIRSNSRVILSPVPNSITALEGEEGLRALKNRLEILGYHQFTFCISESGQMQVIDDRSFKEGLTQWANSQSGPHIGIAYRKILDAFHLNATKLDLSNLFLTTLPKELFQLSNLTELLLQNVNLQSLPKEINHLSNLTALDLGWNKLQDLPKELFQLSSLTILGLSSNKLENLPDELNQLSKLKRLYIRGNKLKFLPTWIGNFPELTVFYANGNPLENVPIELFNLSRLTELDLRNTYIQNLPPQIENLSSLRYLYLNYTALRSLPREIGNLSNLERLEVEGSDITTLPLALGHCTRLTYLNIENTQIPEDTAVAILTLCRTRRDDEVATVLPQRLRVWEACSGKRFQLGFILDLPLQEKRIISEWLFRLEGTPDFNSSHQKELAESACGILQSLNELPGFKKDFLVQVPVNNVRCEDRSGMAFNEIFLVWKLATLPDDASEKDKLKLMMGAAKTLAFRGALGELIAAQRRGTGESVEIYLYYEIKFKNKFGLLTAIKSMQYGEELGKRDWIENSKGTLRKKMNDNFVNKIFDFEPFKKMLEMDPDFPGTWDVVSEEFADRLDEIEDNRLNLTSHEYDTMMKEVNNERDLAFKIIAINWIEGKLRQHKLIPGH